MEPSETERPRQYPKVTFKLTDRERSDDERQMMEEYLSRLEGAWREIESGVMTDFESIAHGRWNDFVIKNGIEIVLSDSSKMTTHIEAERRIMMRRRDFSLWAKEKGENVYKKPAEIFHQISLLVHELTHLFEKESDDEEYVTRLYGDRVDPNNLLEDRRGPEYSLWQAKIHIHTEPLWDAVMERHCSPEEMKTNREIARNRGILYRESYRILDQLTDEEKRKIIDRSLR